MPDNAYVIPDQDSDWVPNRPVPPREPPDGALRRLVQSDTFVIPDTPDPKPRSLMGDVGRGFASSAVGTVGVAAGFMEYVFGSGGNLTAAREGLNATAEGIAEGMSPQMKTALDREFTALPSWLGGDSDKSAWEGFGTALGSASAQIVAASGSLISAAPAIIAGAMAGSYAVPAAVVVAAATGGALGGGSVWSEVATEFQKMPEAERMKNPVYAKLRETMDEPSAINQTVREVASGYVNSATAVSGLVGAATGPFLGKLGAGKLGGVWQGAKTGLRSEGLEELADEGSNQFFSEAAGSKLTGREFDSGKVVEGAVRGAIGGGGLGGIMGGLGGLRNTERPAVPAVDPSILAATQNPAGTTSTNPAAPTTPPAGPTTTPPVDPSILGAFSANPENRAPAPLSPLDPTAVEPGLVTGAPGPRSGGLDATGQHLLPMEVEGGMAPPAAAPVAEAPEAPNPNQAFLDFVMQGLGAADNEAALGLLDRSPKIAAQIRALHESGKNARTIADDLNFNEAFVVAALKAIGVAPAPVTPTPAAPVVMRLYRGEDGSGPMMDGSPATGGWFTTDPKKAARYGTVRHIDVTRDDMMSFAQGHGGPDEWVTTNPKFMQTTAAPPVAPAAKKPRARKPKKEAAPPTPPESAITPTVEPPLQDAIVPVSEARTEVSGEAQAPGRVKAARDAYVLARDELRARARLKFDQLFGEDFDPKDLGHGDTSKEESISDLVREMLDEARAESKDSGAASVKDISTLLLNIAGPRIEKTLQDTHADYEARDGSRENDPKNAAIRISANDILESAKGGIRASRRIRKQLGKTAPGDLGRVYKRAESTLLKAGVDPTTVPWMKELADIATTAKAGGSIADRQRRAAFVRDKLAAIAQQGVDENARFAADRANVMAAIESVKPNYSAGAAAGVTRFRATLDAIAESVGVEPAKPLERGDAETKDGAARSEASRIEREVLKKVGVEAGTEGSDAGGVEGNAVEFFAKAARLTGDVPSDILGDFYVAEHHVRSGVAVEGMDVLKRAAGEKSDSFGTGGDTDDSATGEQADDTAADEDTTVGEEIDPDAMNRLDEPLARDQTLPPTTAETRRAQANPQMRLTVEDRGNTRTPDAESEGEPDFVAGKANDGVATQVIHQRTAEEIAAAAAEKKRLEAAAADLRKRNAASGGMGVGTGLGTLSLKKMADAGPTITRRGLLRGVGAAVLSWTMGDKVFAQTVPASERARNGDFQGAMEAIAKHSPNAAHRALAKRLAPLVKGIPIKVIEFGKTYNEGIPAALNSALGVTIRRVKDGHVAVWLRHDPSGKRASGLNDETMLHEAIHAALMSRYGELDSRRTLGGGIGGKAMPGDEHIRDLNALYIAYRDFFIRQPDYKEQRESKAFLRASVGDLDEFIAYATTSPEFQAWMKEQTLNKVGMWQRFVNAVAGFLGFNKDERTFLDVAMDATNSLLEVAATVPPRYTAPESPVPANAGRYEKKQEANDGADDTGEDEFVTKLMAMPARVQEFFDEQIPKNVSESFLANMVGRLKKVGLGFSTTRQIELMGDSQFERTELMDWMDPDTKGNLLHVAVATHAKRRQLAENRLKEFLDPIRQLMGLDHASERKVSELLVDSSMAEAHPDVDLTDEKNKHLKGKDEKKAQARKNHVGLRARYLTLTKEERDAYHAVVDAAAQAHVTAVNSIIHSVVDRWWMDLVSGHLRDPAKNTLPVANKAAVPGFLKGLKNRATSNKLTDDEKLLLGDDWYGLVVKAYARAKMDGPYVPFQRQGEFVVSWVEPAEEFVNFASQEAVDKFALETPYNIVRVKERFYNKAGDEILEPDLGIMLDLQGTAISELGDRPDPLELGRAMRKAARKALEKTRERDATKTVFEVQQQVQGMAMFETEAEANQAARELRELGRKVKEVDLRARPADRRSLLQDADFNKLTQAIERDKTMTDEQKTVAIEALQDAMLMVLPNRTLNSSLVKRRKVLGPSRNVRRVMANYGLAVANFTAGVDTGLTISTALSEMARVTAEGNKATDMDSGSTLSRRRILREIETRILEAPLDNPGTGSRVVRAVQSMAFIHFLASPSYSMIQLTQPWMLTMPILAARFGARSGPAALARATRDIGFGSIMKAGGKDSLATLRTFITGKSGEPQAILEGVRQRLAGMPDGADLNKMLDALSAEGLVDGDAGLELMRAEVTADIWAGRKLGQLEAVTRALPAAIEVINRTSSAVAAYRLAIKAGQTHEQAVLTAREVVDQSQADYSSSNTARYMDTRRYPWLAPMMTFRKYAQAVYALLARQVYLSVKGKDKATRRQAMKTLAYVLGTHVAVAGTLGLPTEAVTIVLGIVAMALGQDEPWDWEQEVRQAMASVFGKEAAEVLTRGLPRMAGIDLSGRMGLNSLIFINDLKDFDRKSTTEYAGGLLLGAPGAMISAWMGAPAQMAKGDYGRAAEALLPKGARDAIKAMRFNEEGITTKRGERIDSNREFTAGDAIMQGLGFTPAAVAETYERRNAVQGASRRFNNERVGLLRDWRQAKPGDRGDVWTRVQKWNQALPPEGRKERITRANLIASEQEAKRRAKASGGADYLPKGREWMRREGEFANTRER